MKRAGDWLCVMLSLGVCPAAWAYSPEAFSHPEAYLEKSFVVSSIAKSILAQLPMATAPQSPVRTMRMVVEQTRVAPGGKQQHIEFHSEFVFLGGGIVRINGQRPDLHFADYELSFGDLLPLRQEMLTYTRPKQGVVQNKLTRLLKFENFPPQAGKPAVLSYEMKTFGLPADAPLTLECSWHGEREARALSPRLVGKLTDFSCDVSARGQKWATDNYVYLQAYGLYMQTGSDTAPRKARYVKQVRNSFRDFELLP